MSSITAADLKLGGRLVTACDAIGAGHLRRAAGIFSEIAGDLNSEAEASDGLLADEGDLMVTESPVDKALTDKLKVIAEETRPTPTLTMDTQSCARGAHNYGPTDPNGWRKCEACGVVNVAPPENNGPVDVSPR